MIKKISFVFLLIFIINLFLFSPQIYAQDATTISSISLGQDQSCVLFSDGTIKCWGDNWQGQLGDGSTTDSSIPVVVSGITNAKSISLGSYRSCALLEDKTIKCWGGNGHGQLGDGSTTDSSIPVVVSGITNAKSISLVPK
jgi:alpha-tubulin suppressor-like RCC1 family protein